MAKKELIGVISYNVNIYVNSYRLQEKRLVKSHLWSRTTLEFV